MRLMSIKNTRRLAESHLIEPHLIQSRITPQATPRGAQRLISPLVMLTLLSVGSLMGCKDKCEVSQRCDRECPEGLIPICVASSICECLDGSSSAGESAGSSAGGAVSGGESAGSMSVEPAPVCDAPAVGDLVINEVMINPSLDEPEYEYVELVNTSDREVDLSEINLTYNMTEKLRFSQGCMAPKSAVAIYSGSSSAPVEWVWSTAPRAVGYSLERFQFVNSREFDFSLFSGSGEWLSSLSGSSSLIKDGESATRLPELTGDATRHGEASSIGTLSSPAHCANGGSFEASCSDGQMGGEPAGAMAGESAGVMAGQTAGELAGETAGVMAGAMAGDSSGVEPPPSCPAPLIGDLLINEVLVNPAGDERTGEFIEILNLSDQEVNLEGVGLWYQSSGGVLELEVSFGRGCMAPKSALVIYNSTTAVAWTWSIETNDSAILASGHSTFQLANSRDAVLELRASSGQRMSEPMVIPASMIDEGVSANRTPDARDTDNIALHTDLNPAQMISPGGCADGSSFELGCGGTP